MASAKRWSGAGWFLAFVAGLYSVSVYNSFFERRPAYIYEPSRDRLFELKLAPSIVQCDKWTPLIPFKSCFFGDVAEVDYRGKLHEKLHRLEVDRKLFEKDSKAWLQKQEEELQEDLQRLLSGVSKGEMEFFDISYFARRSVQVRTLIPQELAVLHEFADSNSDDVFTVDIVITRRKLSDDVTDIEVVKDAVFIRGRAAQKVRELGV
jgi:hypothetical protein